METHAQHLHKAPGKKFRHVQVQNRFQANDYFEDAIQDLIRGNPPGFLKRNKPGDPQFGFSK